MLFFERRARRGYATVVRWPRRRPDAGSSPASSLSAAFARDRPGARSFAIGLPASRLLIAARATGHLHGCESERLPTVVTRPVFPQSRIVIDGRRLRRDASKPDRGAPPSATLRRASAATPPAPVLAPCRRFPLTATRAPANSAHSKPRRPRRSGLALSALCPYVAPYRHDRTVTYKLRWPRPRTVGSGHGRSLRRRLWGTFARVRAHGRYTIRRGFASVSSLARGAPSRCCLLARGAPSRSPAEGSEHPHAGKIPRDHRGP